MKKLVVLFILIITAAVLVACDFSEAKPVTDGDNKPVTDGNNKEEGYASASTLAQLYACNPDDMPTKSDFTYPEGFDKDTVTLHFYTRETGWVDDDENAPFDESKPTVVFAHGMGPDLHMYTPETYYDKGYNVASFMWGTFSNAYLFDIEFAIWDTINYYMLGSDKIPTDGFNCAVPQLYAATYCDFFRMHPTYNMPITFCGHSYGGQLTYAMSLYLTKALKEGKLQARLYPEKFTLLDPYSDTNNVNFDCKWLGETIIGSSYGAAVQFVDTLVQDKVPLEVLRTSPYVKAAMIMGDISEITKDSPDYIKEFMNKVSYLELENSSVILMNYPGGIDVKVSKIHTIAMTYYFAADAKDVYYSQDGSPVFGREVSPAALLALGGVHTGFKIPGKDYANYEGYTFETDYTDDYTEDSAKVAGFVYFDANGNGKKDDGAGTRLDNVTMELVKGDGDPVTVKTKHGYYEFTLEKGASYTLYANAGNYQRVSKTFTAESNITIQDILMDAVQE